MVDWVSGMADASVAERDSGSVLVRVPGSPDVLKEAPVSGFVTKDGAGVANLSSVTITPDTNAIMTLGRFSASYPWVIIRPDATATGFEFRNNSGDAQFSINQSTGNIGIGDTNPLWKLAITSNTANKLKFFNNGGDGNTIDFSDLSWQSQIVGSGGTLRFNTGGTTERIRIDTVGNVLASIDNTQSNGGPANRWSVVYAGTGTINTSDERAKTDIGEIPDAWLDAWAGVEWRRYKFIDGNRWHVGLVAQQVHAAFAAHDLDAFEIGLCCFDAWEEQREPIFETVTKTRKATRTEQVPSGEDENGEPLYKLVEVAFDEEYEESIDTGKTRVTLEAGDRWGLRYDECQAIEAAYQRRELSRMAARLAALETVGA